MWPIRGNKRWVALLVLWVTGCRVVERPLEPEVNQETSQRLTFQSLHLRQVGTNGQVLWNLRAQQAVVDPQTRQVQVRQLAGDIYDQGQPRYHVQTAQATVREQGETLTMQGHLIARDLKEKTQIQTQALTWRPHSQELVLTGNPALQHPNLQAKAQEATIQLRLNQVALRKSVQVISRQPALHIHGEALDWQWQKGLIQAVQPVNIRYRPQQLVVQAGQGYMDVPNQILWLTQGVQAVHPQGQLRAQQVEWRIAIQAVAALGDVFYRHNNPPLTVTGSRADVHLATQYIRVQQASTQWVP